MYPPSVLETSSRARALAPRIGKSETILRIPFSALSKTEHAAEGCLHLSLLRELDHGSDLISFTQFFTQIVEVFIELRSPPASPSDKMLGALIRLEHTGS